MDRMTDVSIITCPTCGFAKTEVMPATSCIVTYQCTQCGSELGPGPGDCCVFCTYGSVPCQAIQAARDDD